MAHALLIEEESGTSRGFLHPHNGYYAGDFHQANIDHLRTAVFARFPHQASGSVVLVQTVPHSPHLSPHDDPRAA